jgi:3-oxoacyl-[acyl-carrier protein] reductase
MDLQLSGKTALVTGASAGIGTGIAKALAAEGVRLAVAGRNAGALETVAGEIGTECGTKPSVILGDISMDGGPGQIANAALHVLGGRVDILVNNAGGARPLQPLQEDDDEVWLEAFKLNFTGARRLTMRLVPAMKDAKWGRIISLTGALAGAKLNAAGPAKAALATWSRTLAFELGPFGITVNTIAPGRINSVQILTKLHPTEQSRADYIRQNIPAGYFGEPEDVGRLAAFLASPLARYISGAAIPVDGGAVRMAF